MVTLAEANELRASRVSNLSLKSPALPRPVFTLDKMKHFVDSPKAPCPYAAAFRPSFLFSALPLLSVAMLNLYEQVFEAGEAQLKNLRTSVCQTPDENAALNVAIAGTPRTPAPDAVRQFLAEARNQARGYPGEHLLNRLVTFTEEDLFSLRPY